MEQRRRRVQNGSRRKRDLAAAGVTRPRERWQLDAEAREARALAKIQKREERERRLLPKVRMTDRAATAWEAARLKLEAAVPESTFGLWLAPLAVRGEVDNALYVTAVPGVFAWAERRYGALIGDAVRAVSDFRGVFLMPDPVDKEENDGCL